MEDDNTKKLLSTSSPEGIQIASKITPTRLANLLIRKGPLPIRHITNQLSLEVTNFNLLSLSKQRRLIMSAMEQIDPTNNVVFEKIGWGQWAVRKIDSDFIVTEGTETSDPKANTITMENGHSHGNGNGHGNGHGNGTGNATGEIKKEENQINVHDLRNQPNLKLGWSKKKTNRRESITNNKSNLHNFKVPNEKLSTSAIVSDSDDDEDSDDDQKIDDIGDDAIDESSSEEESSGSDELFKFDHELDSKRSPPIKFANRVPLKLSPPPGLNNNGNTGNTGSNRRKSSSSNSVTKNTNYKQFFNRSRLNSLENLDNYIISSSKNSNSNISFNSPPPPVLNNMVINGSPLSSWNSTNLNLSKSPDYSVSMMNRRKSSFNESNIRSTLSSSIPTSIPPTPPPIHANGNNGNGNGVRDSLSDTDEEDWETIGAEKLRKNNPDLDETKAALALVDLMSV